MSAQECVGSLETQGQSLVSTIFFGIKTYIFMPLFNGIKFVVMRTLYFILVGVLTILTVIWSLFWRWVVPFGIIMQIIFWLLEKYTGAK